MTIGILPTLLANCPKLETIDLSECKPAGKLDLSKKVICPLKVLNVCNSTISDELVRFVASSCPNLQTLILESCAGISDSSIMKVANSCSNLQTLDVSFCHLITDLSIQVFTLCATQKRTMLTELHLVSCDQISPNTIHQLIQKTPTLELLVLDGCDRMNGSFLKQMATYQDDVTCTLESKELRKLSAIPIQKEDAKKALENVDNVIAAVTYDSKQVQNGSTQHTTEPPLQRTLSRNTSRALLSRKSMMNLSGVKVVEMVLEERNLKIQEQKQQVKVKTVVDDVIERGRRLSVRKSMSDLRLGRERTVPHQMTQINEHIRATNPENSSPSPTSPKGRKTKFNINSPPFISKSLAKVPTPVPTPVPATAQAPEQEKVLLASGRRRSRTTSSTSVLSKRTSSTWSTKSVASEELNTYSNWGKDPTVWNNPTQLTSKSSTMAQDFIDPWASANTSSKAAAPPTQPKSKWSPDRRQTYGGWTARNQPSQPPILEQFQFEHRGTLLVKLKIETKRGGHEELPVHEVFYIHVA
jgi:hypothetical protein